MATTNNNADSGHYIVPDDDEETCYDTKGHSGSVQHARKLGATLFRRVQGRLQFYFNKDDEEKVNKTTKDEKPKKPTTKDEETKEQTTKDEETKGEGEEEGPHCRDVREWQQN